MKTFLVTASALAIAASASAASAQAQSVQTQAAQPNAPDADQAGIADIIVTAQKRPETVQKAPLAITSLDTATLAAAHIDGATDLQRIVPNLAAQAGGGSGDPGGASTLFTIRGLGASASGPQGSTGVAAHFDGVYRQDGISNSEFFDLERIEISPGPQGTLYGRSAAAGAINVIPAKPVLGTFHAAASVEAGNYSSFTEQAMLNVPIGDIAAVRIAAQKQDHDGYYSNGYDSLNSFSVRAQLLVKPTDALSIRLAGNYTQLRGIGSGNIFVGGPAYAGLVAVLPQAANADLRKTNIGNYCAVAGVIINTCVQNARINKYFALAEINYNFGGAILTLLPAYARSERTARNANAPAPLSFYDQTPYDNEQLNFEGRLSDSGGGKFKWVVGGNYYRNKVNTFVNQFINTLSPPGAPPLGAPFVTVTAVNAYQDQHSEQSSYAVFAQGTYPVFDGVRLTLGARYNWDKSTGTQILANISTRFYQLNGSGTPLFSVPGLPVVTPLQSGSQSFRAFTYRAAIDVDVGPRSILYASIGSGYKPGGLNDGGPRSSTPSTDPNFALAPEQFYGPEKVTHVELGSKNRFLDNKLQVNIAAYYDDYKNYQNGQTQVVNPLPFGALGFVVTNAGKARIYGAEVSVKWQPTRNDVIELAANYLDAKFTSYTAPGYVAPGGTRAPAQSFAGFPLPSAPDLSGNVSYRHTFDLSGGSKVDASVFSHLTKGYYVYFAQSPGTYQPGYTSTALDLRWTDRTDRFSVAVFVKNVEDNDVKVSGITTAGYSSVGLAAPRIFGGSLSFRY